MKPKGKRVFLGLKSKLAFPAVFFLCLCFFLAGLFGSIIISQDGKMVEPRHRLLESTEVEKNDSMPHGETGDSAVYPIPFQVLSWRPRALYFPNFATTEQCQSIIQIARSTLRPSTLVLREGETAESTKGLRTRWVLLVLLCLRGMFLSWTARPDVLILYIEAGRLFLITICLLSCNTCNSSGTFIRASDDSTGILDYIEKKIARVTMIPKSNGEAFNILRYEVGQRYVPHFDAFDPARYGPQQSQRVASFLLYLTNVEEGGETMFPYEVASDDNGSNTDTHDDYNSCLGLKVKPRQGDGLLFYSLFPNGTIDKTALHGSCPVIKGEKWVATKWIRDQVLYK